MLYEMVSGRLPLQLDGAASDLGQRQPGAGAASPRILLVEDNFVLRAHMAELLLLEGYAVSCAADGIQALRLLKTEPLPFAILLDIMLPRVDGIAFRRAQLQTAMLRRIPAIALTSLAAIEDWRDLQFTEVIKKPVDFDHLLDLLTRLRCPA